MYLFTRKFSPHAVLILRAGEQAVKLYQEMQESRAQCHLSGFVPLEEQDSAVPEDLILESDDSLIQLARKMEI